MKTLKKMIIERLGRINECGGGYSSGGYSSSCGGGYSSGGYSSSCGGGYSSGGYSQRPSGYASGSGRGRRKPGVTELKHLTTLTYGDAFELVKHADALVKEAKRVGKKMPPEMEQKLGAVRKAVLEFVQLIDKYTAN